ncbi:C13 family peptidase [Pseudomonas sp. M30-35]|uniref:C13 family peptidase n=1 Tax=Pseudomonas sp. M30-35 TaxID=1981174 RepID=UPI000B3C4D0D|nr:C13 family peptidase [Pseudomonas sp. M30-35]ARU87182.1 peptidase C13 [Pseudomonas sp. M30-35]
MRCFLKVAPMALGLVLTACGEGESLLPANATLPDGSHYRGQVINGLLQGPGRLDFVGGGWYQGDFKDGQMSGAGELSKSNGEHYIGGFKHGRYHGQGKLTHPDGSHYEGGFIEGLYAGEGTLKNNAMVYRGQFKKGQFSGLGTLENVDKSRYHGLFRAGQANGQGVRTDEYGNQFSGIFSNGLLNGLGSFKSSDSDLYIGSFSKDQFNGDGRYQSAEGDSWSGEFHDGALTGDGEFKGADGSHYLGQFSDWSYNGQGRLSQADGSTYEGRFIYGEYSGQGTLTQADGSKTSGIWLNSKLIRDDQGQALPDPLEIGLLEQGHLLESAIKALPESTPDQEIYALTVAGDGKQSVFMREADFVNDLLLQRFSARGTITLINHRDHLNDRPMATRESIRRAIEGLAQRTGPEDLVFIYLTSHGSRNHELNLDVPRIQFADLPASELAALLKPLAARDKVIVISACYSGGFIPELKNQQTLLMTASRADRVSFGCSDDNDFTYFGRALFANALSQTDDLERAFKQARTEVSQREKEQGFAPSEPQIWAPEHVIKHWRALRAEQAKRALMIKSS